jgi:hypothetical protein
MVNEKHALTYEKQKQSRRTVHLSYQAVRRYSYSPLNAFTNATYRNEHILEHLIKDDFAYGSDTPSSSLGIDSTRLRQQGR